MKWIQRWKAARKRKKEIAHHEAMIREYEREIFDCFEWRGKRYAPMIAYHRGRIEELMSE